MTKLNPRQFTSLDYADADMYGSLTSKPPTATPLNLPLEDLSGKKPSGGISPGEAAYYRDEEARRRSLFLKQQEAQTLREAALREREIARNLALQKTKPAELEQQTVSSRDYEKGLQPPVSTPERQPLPSTGSPPPTPNGTAARASPLVEPTATPASVGLQEAIPVTAGTGLALALPRALPQAAGRLAIPGVLASVDFGNRVIHGQSIVQAGVGAAGGQIGAGLGFVAGSAVGGPLLGLVGGAVGGLIGGAIADYIWAQTQPSTAAHIESNTPNYPPFQGGQSPNVRYLIVGTFDVKVGNELAFTRTRDTAVYGPIGGISLQENDSPINPSAGVGFVVSGYDYANNPTIGFGTVGHSPGAYAANLRDVSVSRLDGYLDPTPDIQQHAPPPDNLPYRYDASPIGNNNTVPSGTPSAGKNKGKTRNVAPSIPENNTPNGAPFFPGHGGLAPSYLPNPTQTPSNLGGMLPAIKPAPTPLPFAEPEDLPAARVPPRIGLTVTPSEGGIVLVHYADVTPATITPSTGGLSEGTDANGNYIPSSAPVPTSSKTLPSSSPRTATPSPVADSLSPVPKTQTAPIAKTPEQAATDKTNQTIEQQKKDFDEQVNKLTSIAAILAGLTPVIQGIPDAIAHSPTVQAANRATTQGAVCEIAQPGRCLGDALDDSAQKVNQNNNQNTANLLDKINAGANAAQLALLELINRKLGDLLPGGLSGTFTRLWQTLQVDRILNILILITTFYNALMLSNNLAQTLFAATDNISQAVGFKWKNEKGEESGFGSIVSEWTASFFKNIFGEENYTELVADYKKANRIYQATANIFNALQSISYSILSALEVVGSYVALIGNALRKWGEVGETAYKWFNPQPNFHNKFFTTLEGATNVVSQVDQVASNQTILAANSNRKGAIIWNDSTASLFLEFGAAAATNAFTAKLNPGGYYEVPFRYTGVISGLWSAANGNALVRELT
ncbi:hypothetical protein [Nostoc sp.]|uniref:hypothetical protein n=1 Tax=Nostoc sp. TaxID=1180 RepID=UPI002FF93A03